MGGNQSSTRLSNEEARKKELEKYGILIPPSFGIGSSTIEVPSNIVLRQPPTTPSLFTLVQQRSNSHRILTEYMTPSATIVSSNSPAEGNRRTNILAGCTFQDAKASYENALLQVDYSTSSGLLRLDGQSNGQLCLRGLYGLSPTTELFGSIDGKASRNVWFGGRTDYRLPTLQAMRNAATSLKSSDTQQRYYRNDPFQEEDAESSKTQVSFGTWCDCHLPNLKDSSAETSPFQAVAAYTSLVAPSYTLVAEGRLPLGASITADTPQICYHASCDLNPAGGDGPPLMVELNKTPTYSSISLHQILSFDRQVLNPVEVRAPKVRNTLGWTVALTSASAEETTAAPGDTASTGPTNSLQAGLAWQVNRSVACKLVGTLTEQRPPEFRGAVIFKRWQQPGVTASLLFGFDHQQNTITFRGIGFELGTGNGQQQYVYSRNGSEDLVQEEPPATKAVLPGEEV